MRNAAELLVDQRRKTAEQLYKLAARHARAGEVGAALVVADDVSRFASVEPVGAEMRGVAAAIGSELLGWARAFTLREFTGSYREWCERLGRVPRPLRCAAEAGSQAPGASGMPAR